MGIAMWTTLAAMVVTAFGALALSTDPDVVKASHWIYLEAAQTASFANATDVARGTNATRAKATYYLGLRSILTVYENGETASDRLDVDLGGVVTIPGQDRADPMREALLESCADSAAGSSAGALLSCVTLIFALVGTVNRMKFSSDANVQKGLGLVTDTWGAFALTFTLANFYFDCYNDIERNASGGIDVLDVRWGPGWYCYVFCAFSGIVRAWAHWVTPTPGHGAGICTFTLPESIRKLLDADGDGILTWEDQKLLFSSLKAILAREAGVS